MSIEVIAVTFLAAVGWSVAGLVVSQGISILLMTWLGLPPKKLVHEIEDVQNAAVGACFFTVSVTTAFFIGFFTSNGFTDVGDALTEGETLSVTGELLLGAFWIVSALILSVALMWLTFEIAHWTMDRVDGETTKQYIQRELIAEQNAALALFLGGIATTCFICVIFQMI